MPGSGNSGGKKEAPKRVNPLQGMREDAERAARARIKKMEEDAEAMIERFREEGFSYEEAMSRFEQSYQMAIATRDAAAMNAAAISMAKMSGLWIEKQATLHAHVGLGNLQGNTDMLSAQSLEGMRERIGSAKLDKLLRFLKDEGIIRDIPELTDGS